MLRTLSAALVALIVLVLASADHAKAAGVRPRGVKVYCKPGQPCWPSAAELSAFNATVGGRLLNVKPFAIPCFSRNNTFLDIGAGLSCANVGLKYNDGMFRTTQPGALEFDNFQYCSPRVGPISECNLDATSLAPGLTAGNRVCGQGRIPPLAVAVSKPEDVVAALAFAKAKNIRVVIKNTGHDYLARSAAPDSLMIWTHNLQGISSNANFVPAGCPASDAQPAQILGAGVRATDSYTFAEKNKRVLTHGAVESVGVAGGFALGGGHGPLGPKYGLAVDNILQFTVVTADGVIRTANKCQNQDLFWALRGGGGGSFGVVTETVYKTYPDAPVAQSTILIQSFNRQALADVIAEIARLQPSWYDAGMATYFTLFNGNGSLGAISGLPGGTKSQLEALIKPLEDFCASRLDVLLAVSLKVVFPTVNSYVKTVIKPSSSTTPVGITQRLSGRNLPRALFNDPAGRRAMAETFIAATDLLSSRTRTVNWYSTGPNHQIKGDDTSANPVWRSSLWSVVFVNGDTATVDQATKDRYAREVTTAVQPLIKLTPGGGCYVNECDVAEENWKQAYYGSNYDRLLSIKQKYDPSNVFIVWKGIGYEGQESQDVFKCYERD